MDEETLLYLVGKRLTTDLIDAYGAVLIPKDRLVTYEDILKALGHPIDYIPIAQPDGPEEPSDPLPPDETVKNSCLNYSKVVNDAVGQLTEVFDTARHRDRVPLLEVQKLIIPSVAELTSKPDLAQLLYSLHVKDNYTTTHCFAVSVLSTLIGGWLNMDHRDLSALTIAAALHDVGKMKIPLNILNKPGKLTAAEYNLIKRHTVYGYELIHNTVGMSLHQALTALQHHERIDGTGYPFHLKDQKICLFAKIVSVADVFHAMSSKRIYHDALPLYAILREMQSGRFGQFDPKVIMTFVRKMMDSLVGSHVVLSDGRMGEIVLINAQDPTLPLVKCGEQFIDLAQNPRLQLQSIKGTTSEFST